MHPSLRPRLGHLCGLLAAALLPTQGLRDLRVEPFGMEAGAEVPIYISFSSGTLPAYGQAEVDDGSARMLLAVYIPEVELGQNNDCSKLLEAPGLPPLRRCIRGPDGIMALELRATLEKNTRYDLLVLGTLPAAGIPLRQLSIRVLHPGNYVDFNNLDVHEEAILDLVPQLMVVAPTAKAVSALEFVASSTPAQQGMMFYQYTLKVTGSNIPFGQGDRLRIFSSPFIFEDEGLAFGGPCDGFDVSGFASPLLDCSCEVVSLPADDARVGYNAFVLTFGPASNLAEVPQYFRIALNTPQHMGSMGRWYVASYHRWAAHNVYNHVIPAAAPFFVAPHMRVFSTTDAVATPTYGATQQLLLTILPQLNILGSTSAPPTVTIQSPTFHSITFCRNRAPSPEILLVGVDIDAHCQLKFQDNQNLYVHQRILATIDVANPPFAVVAEDWTVTVESVSASPPMRTSATILGWPVYASLIHGFLVPMTMEYAKWNELQVFLRPSTSSPPEPRVVVVAPEGFIFGEECAFEVILGFPLQGLQCSNPLSEAGRNLFALRMPMMAALEAGQAYAASIYPLRNPHPGSHTGPLDALAWHINVVASDGITVLETRREAPLGPHLRGFQVYPRSVINAVVLPESRLPGVETLVTLRFRASVRVAAHGERLLVTAPYGYAWKLGGAVHLTVGSSVVRLANIPYEEAYPPRAVPHNQIEVTLIDPDIAAGDDLALQGTVLNALIDSLLNAEVQSANVWLIEMYEPGAGYLHYEYRHQAGVVPGFSLQAVTGGSVSAWLPIARRGQTSVGVTFRLGTGLASNEAQVHGIEVRAPEGFFFPEDCAAQRISPVHLPAEGFWTFPAGAIEGCSGAGAGSASGSGAGNVARVTVASSVDVIQDRLYALLIEVIIPSTLPQDNTWGLSSFLGPAMVESQPAFEGFRLATEFLSALYHPGTSDTGENLRVGASDNRVMFSLQPASAVLAGGELRITAPHRFLFARECAATVYPARAILTTLDFEEEDISQSMLFEDLPAISRCQGSWNIARLSFQETLDVAVRYSFRIAVTNPQLPHPAEWPLEQNVWRLETLDPLGGLLNAAEVRAFFLWAFALASVTPLSSGVGELALVTVDVQPSLTVPPRGLILVTAPANWGLPVPCNTSFQPDTHSQLEGLQPLPPGTSCGRGPGDGASLRLQLDGSSYLAAGATYRFRLQVQHPAEAETQAQAWALASAEETELGESFLEQNPSLEGYAVHETLESFIVVPEDQLAERRTRVTFTVSVPESIGTFGVASSTETSFLVVDMPLHFSTPVMAGDTEVEPSATSGPLQRCAEFLPIYPEFQYFPVSQEGCRASAGRPHIWLELIRDLLVGPEYSFQVAVLHPTLTSVRQRQLELANLWQVRLVRTAQRIETTYASKVIPGYRVVPLLFHCSVRSQTDPLGVDDETLVSVGFQVVSALSGAVGDHLQIVPPPSISARNGTGGGAVMCQLWIDSVLQPASASTCMVQEAGLRLTLHLDTTIEIEESTNVQLDFMVHTGATALAQNSTANLWSVTSLSGAGEAKDVGVDVPGFTVFPALEEAAVVPRDTLAMSFTNHATFRFRTGDAVADSQAVAVMAPEGFVLYPATFRPSTLESISDSALPTAWQGASPREAVIWLPGELKASTLYSFLLTIGNPAVSPPQNTWQLEVWDSHNRTLSLHAQVPGFIVHSHFNTSLVSGQVDEPLAENYVHITVAVAQRLLADFLSGSRTACVPTPEHPVCPPRWGARSLLVVRAPTGFSFQPTCGFWVLSRVGSRHPGLPPGSLCRADPLLPHVAHVQLSLSLEPGQRYEFTLQVRNALSVPKENVWALEALQDGVLREQNLRVEGFPLRQFRSVSLVPSTTLAGAVDNTVTVRLRSERPVTRASVLLLVAPAGFVLEPSPVSGSFLHPLVAMNPDSDDPSRLRVQLSEHDFVPPNSYFFVSVRVRNPFSTPANNLWNVYLQSQYTEHIDLRKNIPGFVVALRMLYCRMYPNTVPWEMGTPNDISVFFVTQRPLFIGEVADSDWEIVLVAPVGFIFPAENKYSERCSGFRRWGGRDSYDQLPDLQESPLTCTVRSVRSIQLRVPLSIVNETRYSFRINVTTAQRREDIASQDNWRLTVLQQGEILHIGNSPSPLLDTFYVPEWLWVPGIAGAG